MAVAGTLSTGDFAKLYEDRLPYLNTLIGVNRWSEVESQWMNLFKIESSKKIREEFLEWAGFGGFREVEENDAVTYDQIVQGPQKTFTHKLWGLGFQIGLLSRMFDLSGICKKHGPALGLAMRNSIQTQAFAFYNGAFGTYTCADAKYYIDTAHTYIRGGGTFDNMPSTGVTLSHSVLETALINFMNQKNFQGEYQPIQPKYLLIPPALVPTAHELLRSTMRSDTTTHANSWLTNQLEIIATPFLTTTTMWFILAPKGQREAYWFWALKPTTTHGFDFDTEAAKTKALYAFSGGFVDPRGAYGSYVGAS
jgi:hypothetical protein